MFCKKGVLENFAKFTGKHLCRSLKKLRYMVTDVFLWILRTPIFRIPANGWLLLSFNSYLRNFYLGFEIFWNKDVENFLKNFFFLVLNIFPIVFKINTSKENKNSYRIGRKLYIFIKQAMRLYFIKNKIFGLLCHCEVVL